MASQPSLSMEAAVLKPRQRASDAAAEAPVPVPRRPHPVLGIQQCGYSYPLTNGSKSPGNRHIERTLLVETRTGVLQPSAGV